MTPDAPDTFEPAAAARPARRRRARWPFWLAGVAAFLLIVLPGIALWWISSDDSLDRMLRLAQRFLPADQTLVFTDAEGSITRGGSIGQLQWEKPGLALTIDGLRLDWSLREYFDGDMRVRTLHARNVLVRLTPVAEPPPEEPFVMPAELMLPVKVTVPLAINRLEIQSVGEEGAVASQVIGNIAAGYRFNGRHHALHLQSLAYGDSRAQAALQLDGRELTLAARIGASLRDPVAQVPLAMLVRLQADGTLAGGDAARIEVQLDAREQARAAPPPDAASLLRQLEPLAAGNGSDTAGSASQLARVDAQAILHPWRAQPVQQLDLQGQRLNAGAFHASAPATLIDAEARVQPVPEATSATWNLLVTLSNLQPGAWDAGRLPLRSVEVRGALSRELAVIETADVQLDGSVPAGSVHLTGRLPLGQGFQPTLRLQLEQMDLRPLMGSLPRTRIDGQVAMDPADAGDAEAGWQARIDIRNGLAGPLDAQRLPLDSLVATLHGTPSLLRAESLQLNSGDGQLQAEGEWLTDTRALKAQAALRRLPLRRIHRDLAGGPAELSGNLSVAGDLEAGLVFDADIRSDVAEDDAAAPRAEWELRAVETQGRWSPRRLQVARIHLDAFGATADGNDIDVTLPGMDSIQATLKAAAPGLALDADAQMRRSSGGGKLSLQLVSAEQLMDWMRGLPLVGERVPEMVATGGASLEADWQGGWRQWREGIERPSRHPDLRLDAMLSAQGLHVEMPAASSGTALVLDVDSLGASAAGNLAAATLLIDGDLRLNEVATALDVRMQMTRGESRARNPLWQFTFEQLRVAATLPEQAEPWQLQVSDGLQLSLAAGADDFELRAAAGQLILSPPADPVLRQQNLELAWQPMLWRQSAGVMNVQSSGTVSGLQPGWVDLLRLAPPPGPLENSGLRTDLVIDGEWNLQLDDELAVDVHLFRNAGDVWLLGPALPAADNALRPPAEDGIAAGLRTFDVRLQSVDEQLSFALDWDTEDAGTIKARAATQLARVPGGWKLADAAPLSGSIEARLQDTGIWGFLAPPGWRMQGTLQADIQLDGTVQDPQLRGPIEASGLTIRSVLDGVELNQGALRANLEGQQLQLQELTFQGGTGSKAYVSGISGNRTQPPRARGSMRATGTIDWSGIASAAPGDTGITVDMQAELDRMQVLVRNDRQLSLSGELTAGLAAGALRVRGDLNVDRATILLPEAGAPTLGDDVVVLRGDEPLEAIEALAVDEPRGGLQATRRMDVEIAIDLGRDLALHGQGITTRLEGELTVRSSTNPGQPFAVYGEVRTDEGRYRAWGQSLDVETGIVAFNGSYMNPALNLLAIRPEIEVRAGVRVTGTLLAPRVELYSDPPLPEAEKLSWVVLGRATAVSGGEGTSMQRAALGLLAGRAVSSLTDDLGVDELGLDESALSIGKRISDKFYVTYEAGLSGAASTLYIFYDLTRRLTLRGETGEASAVDLIYTIDYD